MPEITPSHFDLIILGTGLQAALLAGRAALAGKTVLHLDQADHYGGAWSTLSLEHLQRLAASPKNGSLFGIAYGMAANADLGRLASYAFDLASRVLYCAGPAIEALVSTGAHHYLEFKLISGNYFWNGSRLQSVPAGRSDVFQDRSLSLTSKRMLMRFLKNLQDAMEDRGPLKDSFNDTLFVTLLERQGLDEQLRHVLLHAIALSPWGSHAEASTSSPGVMTAAEAQRALAQHAASMGRFGPGTGAFLTPLYGGSEMSQAFCRVAAVHGALYVLRQPIDALLMGPAASEKPDAPRKCRGVRLDTGQEITCGALAADPEYLSEFQRSKESAISAAVSRAICVLDQPLQVAGQQVLMTFPPGSFPGGCHHAVHALQLSPACAVTPPDRYLLQLSAPATNMDSAAADFLPVLDALLEVPPEVRRALTKSLLPMPASVAGGSPAGIGNDQGFASRAARTSDKSSAPSQAAAGNLQDSSPVSVSSSPSMAGPRIADGAGGAIASTSDSSPASSSSSPSMAGSRAVHAAGVTASTSDSSQVPGSSSSAGSRASALQDGSNQEPMGAAAASEHGTTSGPDPAVLQCASARCADATNDSHIEVSADARASVPGESGNCSQSGPESLSKPAPYDSNNSEASSDPHPHPVHSEVEGAANPHADASSDLPAPGHLLQGGSSLDKPSTSVPDNTTPAAAQEPLAATSRSQPPAVESAQPRELQSKRPVALFAACWTQHIPDRARFELPENVGMCSPPDAHITFDAALAEVDCLIDRLYGSGVAASWDGKRGLQDDESDEEAVEALSHALEQTTVNE